MVMQEYERISRMGPYELEEVGLEAYHNNHFEEAGSRVPAKSYPNSNRSTRGLFPNLTRSLGSANFKPGQASEATFET